MSNFDDLNDMGFECEFAGYKTIALNKRGDSLIFCGIKGYDLYCSFVFDGMTYTVLVYPQSKDIDAMKLVEVFGGWGDQHSAGFQSYTLPFVRMRPLHSLDNQSEEEV